MLQMNLHCNLLQVKQPIQPKPMLQGGLDNHYSVFFIGVQIVWNPDLLVYI